MLKPLFSAKAACVKSEEMTTCVWPNRVGAVHVELHERELPSAEDMSAMTESGEMNSPPETFGTANTLTVMFTFVQHTAAA